ncbi:MAG: glucose-6-phosphate dehydrogenase, partial [Sulfuricurvum sp.]|nr:glucose-6-phosphate dehydrogenase [Sulfuricurvum sp.]
MATMDNVCDIIIFGGHGDLSFRKLIPALYHLSNDGYLSIESRIVIVTRQHMSDEEHEALLRTKLDEFLGAGAFIESKFERFLSQLHMVTISFDEEESYSGLKTLLDTYPDRERVNYLSTAPDFFATI